jgi:hypothetical protein
MGREKILCHAKVITPVFFTFMLTCLLFLFVSVGSAQITLDNLGEAITHSFDCPYPRGEGPCNCPAGNAGQADEPPAGQTEPPLEENHDPGTELYPGDIVQITPEEEDINQNPEGADNFLPPTEQPIDNDQPGSSDGYNLDNIMETGYPEDSVFITDYTDYIPNEVIPAAAGLVAVLTAMGALGVASVNGISAGQIYEELSDLLHGRQEQLPAERSPQDIINSPRLHDRVTDVDGKEWVYYHRPGDLAGDGWTTLEDYEQTARQENYGKTWSDRWGWVSPGEMQEYEAARSRAEQAFRRETDDLLRQLVESEKRQMESLARSNQLQNEIVTAGKLAGFSLDLAEETKKMHEDGYWVRNPYNSKAIDKLNMLHSPLDKKGVRCQDLVDLKEAHIRKLVAERFGKGTIVDSVLIGERSSVDPKGIVDHLDAVFEYNHNAIRFITPDGKAYIVDYWEALHHGGSGGGIIRPEEDFVAKWKKPINIGEDIYYETHGSDSRASGAEATVNSFVEKYGPEEGIRVWEERMTKVISESAIPDQLKEEQVLQLKTYVNYYRGRGNTVGY